MSEAIVYTQEELSAMREVRTKLIEKYGIEESRMGSCFLALATINCKLRVDETVEKLKKLLDILVELDCPEGIDDNLWKPEAVYQLKPYMPCGQDTTGSSITWIASGSRVTKEEQRDHAKACIMQVLAVHADATSMRKGITFVIDGSISAPPPKVGNERTIQKFYQAFPQRPQAIMIAGTNVITRAILNTSIKIASLFTKQKVLDRIKFVTVEQAKNSVPISSAPKYVGGEGGDIDDYEKWLKERLAMFTKPDL